MRYNRGLNVLVGNASEFIDKNGFNLLSFLLNYEPPKSEGQKMTMQDVVNQAGFLLIDMRGTHPSQSSDTAEIQELLLLICTMRLSTCSTGELRSQMENYLGENDKVIIEQLGRCIDLLRK